MFWINLKIALRNLRKYKLYAAINVLGLAIGMTIYVFTGTLINTAADIDGFFENSDRIYTVASTAGPEIDVPWTRINTTFTALGPIIDAELTDIEATARTMPGTFYVRIDEHTSEEEFRFADAALLDIFDFEYLYGDKDALRDPTGVVLTESAAIRLFGNRDILGSTLRLDNRMDLQVAAVIKDISPNASDQTEILAPIDVLVALGEFQQEGNWNIQFYYRTFVLLPPYLDEAWLNAQLESLYQRHTPENQRQRLSNIFAIPLSEGAQVENFFGMPLIYLIWIPSILVIAIACVNYTNLATAQSLARSREIGMRKTMGATKAQLLWQFLMESILVTALAMLLAIAGTELLIPLANNMEGASLQINYLSALPWLITTTLVVGLAAGTYPAWMITHVSPINALRDIARKGKTGSGLRSFMIGFQFTISIFLLAGVALLYAQHKAVDEATYAFPKTEIFTLTDLQVAGELIDLDLLQHEIEALPTVDSVAFSNGTPFVPRAGLNLVSLVPGDDAGAIRTRLFGITPGFFATYDIPFLAGRNLDKNIANDDLRRGVSESLNIVINEFALVALGIDTPEKAINQRLFSTNPNAPIREFIIVGVVSAPFIGLLNGTAVPWFFYIDPSPSHSSIRFAPGTDAETIKEVEAVWNRIAPTQPMKGAFLEETANQLLAEPILVSKFIAAFALVASTLALVGLFGLSAFMSAQRIKEICVRKVFGADSRQIAALLTWQISKPIVWALAIALPAVFIVSKFYLSLWAVRIESTIPIILASGLIALLLGWATVAGQTYRLARANPISALRYE